MSFLKKLGGWLSGLKDVRPSETPGELTDTAPVDEIADPGDGAAHPDLRDDSGAIAGHFDATVGVPTAVSASDPKPDRTAPLSRESEAEVAVAAPAMAQDADWPPASEPGFSLGDHSTVTSAEVGAEEPAPLVIVQPTVPWCAKSAVRSLGLLNLGSSPADPIIAELVALNETEVRLGNAISVADSEGALPLEFVSEYMAAGTAAPELFKLRVRNLGQKTVQELDALVRAAHEQSQPASALERGQPSFGQPLSTPEIREAVAAFFGDRPIEVVLSRYSVSARFTNAIFLAGWRAVPFAEILLDFPAKFSALRVRPNLGRISLAAGEAVIVRAVADALRHSGFDKSQVPQVIAALLYGQELSLSWRLLISETLGRLTSASPTMSETGARPPAGFDLSLEIMTDAQIRRAAAELFGDDTLGERFEPTLPSVRLWNVLFSLGWTEQPLREVLVDVPAREKELLAQPNMGRVSLKAWRSILAALIAEKLVRGGFSEREIHVLQAGVLEDAVIRGPERAELTRRFYTLGKGPGQAYKSAVLESPDEVPQQTAPDPAVPLETLLLMALEELDERMRAILLRRYGINRPRETLEEISQTYGVTRERIRQIERKALLRLRMKHQRALSGSIALYGQEAWNTLASGRLVLQSDLSTRRRRISPWFELALDIIGQDLRSWLDSFGQPCGDGWVEMGFDVSRLEPVRARLRCDTGVMAGPRAVSAYQAGEAPEDVVTAVLLEGWSVYSGYVVQSRPRARLRRAVRLHALLGSIGEPVEVNDLLGRYHKLWLDDPCSARDAEIVMEVNRPLFIEVSEGVWSALGVCGELSEAEADLADEEPAEGAAADDVDTDTDAGGPRDEMTIREAIESELRRTGPRRISELIDRAEVYLPTGRSPLSVGPVLLAEKGVFARPLPGIYALHDQVPSAEDVLRTKPAYLFEEHQVRTYVMARRAGEMFGSYALWTPEVEYLWCGWARKHADTPLLEALLSVIEPDAWPAVEDADEWRALKARRGRFTLHQTPREEVFTLPELDHVLAACKFIESRRGLGWVMANRILFRRPNDHNSAGLLAVLVGLGALAKGAEDWQAPHIAGPRLGEIRGLLEAERGRLGLLSWSSPLGVRLQREALAAELPDGWVASQDLRRLMGDPAVSDERDTSVDEEPTGTMSFLDELLAEQTRRHEEERLAAVLAELAPSRPERS
jgi:hypothetical protein